MSNRDDEWFCVGNKTTFEVTVVKGRARLGKFLEHIVETADDRTLVRQLMEDSIVRYETKLCNALVLHVEPPLGAK